MTHIDSPGPNFRKPGLLLMLVGAGMFKPSAILMAAALFDTPSYRVLFPTADNPDAYAANQREFADYFHAITHSLIEFDEGPLSSDAESFRPHRRRPALQGGFFIGHINLRDCYRHSENSKVRKNGCFLNAPKRRWSRPTT
ncbi:hypothetical protein [Herbiconiux ginsengi]|uniref:hypothetical protein n=1 Tax=Herbiconiux ginsengi TaxID=381665 RepID=UPI001114F4B6|nr:hypothetical protein [Herbiconiux ginsengi]